VVVMVVVPDGLALGGPEQGDLGRHEPAEEAPNTGGKKAFNPGLSRPLIPVSATGTNKARLKAPAFSPGRL
jgi:hypothetical protein